MGEMQHVVKYAPCRDLAGTVEGTATGAITVVTGIFVMPGEPYLQALAFERDKMVQALGISFTNSTITFALALAHTGGCNGR